MSALFITSSEFKRLLGSWTEDRPVYVPVSRGGHRHWWRFSPETGAEPELDGIRAVEPLKTFYFHVKETVAKYPSGPGFPDDEPGFVLVGAKNCDLRSLECLDQTFARGDIQDPFWVSRREKAFVIGADCSDPAPSCFCTLLDMMPYPQSSFDLSAAVVSGGLILEVGTEKGAKLLEVDGVELSEAT
ncbi:MAG: hypothetical protein IMY84_01210, partial [Chloroflexi bacterium]|nr:hypothetical protein [Chloroflexota bacterium]